MDISHRYWESAPPLSRFPTATSKLETCVTTYMAGQKLGGLERERREGGDDDSTPAGNDGDGNLEDVNKQIFGRSAGLWKFRPGEEALPVMGDAWESSERARER